MQHTSNTGSILNLPRLPQEDLPTQQPIQPPDENPKTVGERKSRSKSAFMKSKVLMNPLQLEQVQKIKQVSISPPSEAKDLENRSSLQRSRSRSPRLGKSSVLSPKTSPKTSPITSPRTELSPRSNSIIPTSPKNSSNIPISPKGDSARREKFSILKKFQALSHSESNVQVLDSNSDFAPRTTNISNTSRKKSSESIIFGNVVFKDIKSNDVFVSEIENENVVVNPVPVWKHVHDFKKTLCNTVAENMDGENLTWSEIKEYFGPLCKATAINITSEKLASAAGDIWRIADKCRIGRSNKKGDNEPVVVDTIIEVHPDAYNTKGIPLMERNKRFVEILQACTSKDLVAFPTQEELTLWTKLEYAQAWARNPVFLQNPVFCRYLYSFNQSRYTASLVAALVATKYGIEPASRPLPLIIAKPDTGKIIFGRIFHSEGRGSCEIIDIPINIVCRDPKNAFHLNFKETIKLRIRYDYDSEFYLTRVKTSVAK